MIPALTPSAVSPRTTSPVHSDSEIDPLDELCKMPGDEGVDGGQVSSASSRNFYAEHGYGWSCRREFWSNT
jgi:hypothetical protein